MSKLARLLCVRVSVIFTVGQLGLFSPVFIIGGLIGRVFGEAAHWMDKDIDSFDINFKVLYAVWYGFNLGHGCPVCIAEEVKT